MTGQRIGYARVAWFLLLTNIKNRGITKGHEHVATLSENAGRILAAQTVSGPTSVFFSPKGYAVLLNSAAYPRYSL